MRLAAIALVVGCATQPAPPPSPPANACDAATAQLVVHIEQLASKAGHETTADEHAQLARFRAAIAKRCTQDAWPDDAIRCFRDSSDEAVLVTCVDKLSAAQRANVERVEFPVQPSTDNASIAKHAVETYAFEAYPRWAAAHPDQACPAALAELREYTSDRDDLDPWGHPYKMMCGPSLPTGAHGLAIASAGPDGVFDTADDIRSW